MIRAVGSYVRDLAAPLPRLIENALDWEHLPHLHATDFAGIAIVDADEWGWTADATLPGGASLRLDLRLDPEDRIAACVPVRSFEKGSEIIGEHEDTTDVFFILAGMVRVTSFTSAGREVIFSDVPSGGVFGEFSAVDRLPRSTSVVALTDCRHSWSST